MSKSPLQPIFLDNLTAIMRASRARVLHGLRFLKEEVRVKVDEVVWKEIKGVIHGVLCELDGATSLANHGLVSVIDEEGNTFDRHLHELSFERLNAEEL